MKAHLGEEGTEQFTVTIHRDRELVREQKIHDPFIHSTVIIKISRWDLFKSLFKKQYETRVIVHVTGTPAAQRAIMTLDPEELARENEEIYKSYEKSYQDAQAGTNCVMINGTPSQV